MKTIVVTGGTRGLGLSICEHLLGADYRVIACGRKMSSGLNDLIAQYPAQCFFEQLDLSQIDSIQGNVKSILGRHKGEQIFALVNNAAVGHDGVLATMHDSQILDLININITGTILATKYVLRTMLKHGEGRIINISSIIASTGYSGLSVYAASKSALEGFTKSLAREVGKIGINVNAVAPGYMQTDMTSKLDAQSLEKIIRRSPMKKLPATSDVANAVVYLIKPTGDMITGITFTIDAGNTI